MIVHGTVYISFWLTVWDQEEKWWQLSTGVDLSLQRNCTQSITWCS